MAPKSLFSRTGVGVDAPTGGPLDVQQGKHSKKLACFCNSYVKLEFKPKNLHRADF
jgi:hypothetical protein